MSEFLGSAWWWIVSIGVLVTFHEFGHFWVARRFGVRVLRFSIGFGREIFGFYDRYGTRWRFAWIPLGGYVKFLDDENSASVPSRAALEKMTPSERAGAFQSQPLAARCAIVAAGPVANFLLAIVIFALTFTFVGVQVTAPRVDELVADGPAATDRPRSRRAVHRPPARRPGSLPGPGRSARSSAAARA